MAPYLLGIYIFILLLLLGVGMAKTDNGEWDEHGMIIVLLFLWPLSWIPYLGYKLFRKKEI